MKSVMFARAGQVPSRGPIARALVALVFAGLFTAACSDSTGPEQLTTLTLTPASSTVGPTATVQLTAAGTRTGQNVTNIVGQTYAVTAGGGTVNSAGLFTAPATVGTSTITVTCGGLTATATVTVAPGPLASITVTPNPTLAIGAQQQFTAVGRDAFNNVVAITPTWSVTGTPAPGTINATTGLFTAGNLPGTYNASVRATSGTIFGTANVIVIAGPLATITVTPDPGTAPVNTNITFTAVGRDAGGNIIAINPTWTVINGGGTVPAGSTGQTVVFTTGGTTGTFTNTLRAGQGTAADTVSVIVTAAPPPPVVLPPPIPPAGVRMIARVAWTCTNGSIAGSVATNQTAAEVPPGSITQTLCPITGTAEIGTAAAKAAYQAFLTAYTARETTACGTTLTGTLAGQILPPGVYCFDNAATLTGTLTLAGPSTGEWLFKIGQAGIPGALAGTSFNVVMAGGASACNVTWWVRQASSMTDSNFQGHILAGAGISFVRGTYKGNAWSKEDVTVTGAAGVPAPIVACDGTLP